MLMTSRGVDPQTRASVPIISIPEGIIEYIFVHNVQKMGFIRTMTSE